jgi:hypothetical protein
MANYKERSNLLLLVDIIKDPDRKSIPRIIIEFFSVLFYYREIPVHYFSRYLFKRGATGIKNYLPNGFLGKKITPNFNDIKVKEVLDNKLFFDMYYRQFKIPLPVNLLYNFKNLFIIGNKNVKVTGIEEFKILLGDLFKHNNMCESFIIKKTLASSSGSNIYKLYHNELNTNPELIRTIYSEVIKSGYLFQKTISQHPGLTKLNPSCLNTIRIDTFTDRDGNIEIISAYLRMSIANHYLDNISSGGCQVGINLETGRLKKMGYATIKSAGTKIFQEHPVTKVIFKDFEIPLFNQVKELVLKTAVFMPGLRLVGWDVAISESGPVLIEGNSDYDISGNDLAYGGYLKNDVFRKVLHETGYL